MPIGPLGYKQGLIIDLDTNISYYLLVIILIILIDISKVQYSKLRFSNNKGGIDYITWKLKIKFFLKEFANNF